MPSSGARVGELLVRLFSVQNLALPNRLVMAPMTRDFSPGGVPGADVAAYYARRAAGGVGLIITEGTYVGQDSAGTSDRVPRFHGTEALLDRLERDEFDLVAVGRALLGDPEWFTKILGGRTAELKPFDVTRLGTLF